MFRFLYVTDLHGWAKGYQAVLSAALEHEVTTIINGGDMLPKGASIIKSQQIFIEEFLTSYIECLGAHDIEYYGMFGNDDVKSVECYWKNLLSASNNAHDMTESWQTIGVNFLIRGCSYVPDHPFGLKDWSTLDTANFVRPPQLTKLVLSKQYGFTEINDVNLFFDSRPTLAEILKQLAQELPSLSRAILVCHAPPAGTGLGNIAVETDVGSLAVRNWIDNYQPLLTLHGHVHESAEITGVHTANLGRTTAHQPGQHKNGALTFSIIALDEDTVRVNSMEIKV